MKPNTYLILTIIFISLSVWLSFTVKKANSEIAQKNRQLQQSEEQNRMMKYRQKIMQEAFAYNMLTEPVTIDNAMAGMQKGATQSFLLYLKANACSPCNIGVIKSIANRYAQHEHFRIASHTSNRHFLMQALHDEEANVIWLNDRLYTDDHAAYDAELLFINENGFVIGRLPLELLKDEELFEPVMAGLL
jgi:hypothetical protein